MIMNCEMLEAIQLKSNWKNVGAMDGGIKEEAEKDGIRE